MMGNSLQTSVPYLICENCGSEFPIAGLPETVTCPYCGMRYEAAPIPDIMPWLNENWPYVALGFGSLVVLYALLK